VALDPEDALSRFGLGKKLLEIGELQEAAEHLRFANRKAPGHLATYHVLADVLIQLRSYDEARGVLTEGLKRAAGVGEGMGRDLGPAMEEMLRQLPG
jgi:tetratricopeptide (TPR) repeat protein